ncbi:MMPL family transporter [Streptomyces sp. HC44]|uniref:MMPL family transporter n=1 Tax=Streptomyces scabichelini TaxID=2711217 RepID=A0A6G4VAP0_9ACTN|nr:MMPL family transporter [Streptomyces scabichelini]NGO10965.1 MMPL family transporter [Streptomyces scabichelini]
MLIGWLLALGAVVGLGVSFAGSFTDSSSIPGSPAQTALTRMERHFPEPDVQSAQIAFQAPTGRKVTDADLRNSLEATLEATGRVSGVSEVSDPSENGTVSEDGRTAVAEVTFTTKEEDDVPPGTLDAVKAAGNEAQQAGLRTIYGGEPYESSHPPVGPSELIGLGVALVILVITFGSLLAAGLPLITAVLGIVGAMAAMIGLATAFDVSDNAPTLAIMLGLAVGIDYALFVVSRHRAQLGTGMPVRESIATATATAGSAVIFAGATVLIALSGLAVAGVPMLTSMGLASAAAVAVAVITAVTLLPALMGMAGHRLTPKAPRSAARRRRFLPMGRKRAMRQAAHSGRTATMGVRWTQGVLRHPVRNLILGTVALIALAVPGMELKLALTDEGSSATSNSSRRAYDVISDAFGPGANGPLVVLVENNDPATVSSTAAAVDDELRGVRGVADVSGVDMAEDETAARIQIIPETGPRSEETSDLVSRLRTQVQPLAQSSGSYVAVTGMTAVSIDVSDKLSGALVPFVIVVVGLSLLLLMIAFRSIAIPVKATIGFLLSVGAAFGATVAVFQWGWLAGPLGVPSEGPVASFVPIIVMSVLFGLAMDYEVFLVSAMREDYNRHRDARTAILNGARNAARVVTSAALIMISVFVSFLFSRDADIMPISFALAFGVMVDAFLVRMTLVPATLALLGDRAWWLPRRLDRVLPHLDVEGENFHTPEPAAPHAPVKESTPVSL